MPPIAVVVRAGGAVELQGCSSVLPFYNIRALDLDDLCHIFGSNYGHLKDRLDIL